MKKIFIILAVTVAAVFVIAAAKDAIIKASIEKGVDIVTGLKLHIGSMRAGIFKSVIDIKRLVLANPAGFSDRTMADMPEIYVRYDLPAVLGGKIHLPEVRLALKEFVVVKNERGELNLNAIRSVQRRKEPAPGSKPDSGAAPAIMIDKLTLSIGKVVYKDYSRGGTPLVKEFNINLNETYTNVDSPYKLANLIVVKALMNTSIAGIANFDLKGLQGTVSDTLAGAQKIVSAAGDVKATIASTGETAKQAIDTAADTAKKAQKTAEQTAAAVQDILKNPFGSDK